MTASLTINLCPAKQMTKIVEYCACGKPLHYSDPDKREMVQNLIDKLGEDVPVQVGSKTYIVPRHFIGLHGLKAHELPTLGFREKKQ